MEDWCGEKSMCSPQWMGAGELLLWSIKPGSSRGGLAVRKNEVFELIILVATFI